MVSMVSFCPKNDESMGLCSGYYFTNSGLRSSSERQGRAHLAKS